jgi:hypothetical protein
MPGIQWAFFLFLVGAPRETPTVNAWYTQIGFWHLQKDSIPGRSFIFHNAHLDGAQSGEATANVRYNKGFDGLTRFQARLALGPAPAVAGLLLQNKQVTYYFFIKKEKTRNFLQISRRKKQEMSTSFITPVTVSDTVAMELTVQQENLRIVAGKTTASVARPADLTGTLWIGFECMQGTVKVLGASAVSREGEMKETFDRASLVNLHLDNMFSPAK